MRVPGVIFLLMCASLVFAQAPTYRTFSQDDLAEKKTKAGKLVASNVWLKFHNGTAALHNGLHVKFNAKVLAVLDSGGFPSAVINDKGKVLDLGGKDVGPGDSVSVYVTVSKKDSGTQAIQWWWTDGGIKVDPKNGPTPAETYEGIRIQPNGGNVLEYLYKKIITRPGGVVIGMAQPTPDSAKIHGWIRYLKADRKFFQHVGAARCFDLITNGNGGTKAFVKELKNPHVKKHDNHLLGELHALKLACIANDSGFTEPIDFGSALFSSLVYNDTVNSSDICNGKSIGEIVHLADSALTYCHYFDASVYTDLDYCISRINAAFDGDYVASSFFPFVIAGTHSLDEVYFLHAPSGAVPAIRALRREGPDMTPERFELSQNYPNPFNPSTTIDFTLPEDAMVTLSVYNLLGQEVAKVLDREQLDAGDQSVNFDAGMLPSGVYFYRIVVDGVGDLQLHKQVMKRMVLIK
jgi:hypothetical protein